MAEISLSSFLDFYSLLPEVTKHYTKLNHLENPLDISNCLWESVDNLEIDNWSAIPKSEFNNAVKAYEMYVNMSDADKFRSKFRQIQCYICEGSLGPEHAGLGTIIIFKDEHGKEIKQLEAVQCWDCTMRYALDVNEFQLVNGPNY